MKTYKPLVNLFGGQDQKNQIKPNIEIDEENLTIYYLIIDIISSNHLRSADYTGKSDPYVEVYFNELMRKTKWIKQTLNPVWNEKFAFFTNQKPNEIKFKLFDHDEVISHTKDDSLGESWYNFKDEFETSKPKVLDLEVYYHDQIKGQLRIQIQGKIMRPIKTEKRLIEQQKKLSEAEQLREHALQKLTQAEQQIIQLAQEIERFNLVNKGQVTEQQQEVLDNADELNEKIKKLEISEIQQKENDIKSQKENEQTKLKLEQLSLERDKINTELSYKDKMILEKTKELEQKSTMDQEQMTKQEKEIMKIGEDLEKKRQENKFTELKLQQYELKLQEIEIQLSLKDEQIILQALELKEKQQQHQQQLTEKEQVILNKANELELKNILHQQAIEEQKQIELKLQDIQNDLTIKEQEIINYKNQLQNQQSEIDQVLTQKQLEIIEQGKHLEEKQKQHIDLQYKLNQLEHSEQEKIEKLEQIEKQFQQQNTQLSNLKNWKEELAKDSISFIKFNITVISGKDFKKVYFFSENDPFVVIQIDKLQAQTSFLKNNSNPVWNESFEFYCDFEPKIIKFFVHDQDSEITKYLGFSQIEFEFDKQNQNKQIEHELNVQRHDKVKGSLKIMIQYQKFSMTYL